MRTGPSSDTRRGGRAGFSLPLTNLLLAGIALSTWAFGPWMLATLVGLVLVIAAGVALSEGRHGAGEHPPAPAPRPAEDAPGDGFVAPAPPPDSTAFVARRLEELLTFLGECLERDERARLRQACEGTGAPGDPLHELAWNWLRENLTAEDLERLYRGRTLPNEPGLFTLGGHESELGHVHVELLSSDGERWRLRRIWMCR